jgi:hypothetical protein
MIGKKSTSTSDQITGKTSPFHKPIKPASHDTMKQWPLEEKKFGVVFKERRMEIKQPQCNIGKCFKVHHIKLHFWRLLNTML